MHRVRLRDDEIRLIRGALKRYYKLVQGKGLLTFEERRLLWRLVVRFSSWGKVEPHKKTPFYSRRRL